MLMTRAYHRSRGEGEQRTKVLVPDSAHGTNPATASMVGYQTVTIPSNERGGIDLEALRAAPWPGHGGADDHQPLDPGHLRGPDRPGGGGGPRGGGHRLHGRRQPERHPRAASARAMPASTSCTSTCTRPSRRRTAVAVRARARSASASGWRRSCPDRMPLLVDGDAAEVLRNARAGRSTPDARFALEADGARAESIGRVRVLHRQLRHVRPRLYLHPQQRRRRAARGQRRRGAGRQLPARAPGRCLRPALRPHLQARGRLLRPPPEAASTA